MSNIASHLRSWAKNQGFRVNPVFYKQNIFLISFSVIYIHNILDSNIACNYNSTTIIRNAFNLFFPIFFKTSTKSINNAGNNNSYDEDVNDAQIQIKGKIQIKLTYEKKSSNMAVLMFVFFIQINFCSLEQDNIVLFYFCLQLNNKKSSMRKSDEY